MKVQCQQETRDPVSLYQVWLSFCDMNKRSNAIPTLQTRKLKNGFRGARQRVQRDKVEAEVMG